MPSLIPDLSWQHSSHANMLATTYATTKMTDEYCNNNEKYIEINKYTFPFRILKQFLKYITMGMFKKPNNF